MVLGTAKAGFSYFSFSFLHEQSLALLTLPPEEQTSPHFAGEQSFTLLVPAFKGRCADHGYGRRCYRTVQTDVP